MRVEVVAQRSAASMVISTSAVLMRVLALPLPRSCRDVWDT
jgi:hypothetical protein